MRRLLSLLMMCGLFLQGGCGILGKDDGKKNDAHHDVETKGASGVDTETRTGNTARGEGAAHADVSAKDDSAKDTVAADDVSIISGPRSKAPAFVGDASLGGEALPSGSSGSGSREGESDNSVDGELLTAGSFDDALNLDIFSNYWKDTGLDQAGISQLEKPIWSDLIPKNAERTHTKLDLVFVVDVTGSMGDELSYLQNELASIVSDINKAFPDVEQRYGMVAYRDESDEFVTKKHDLLGELAQFQSFLNQQIANGGGDYPEAMDEALASANTLQWGGDGSARIIFLVADAPPHSDKINRTFDAIFGLREKGVSIYPIAASGVADLAESIMRTSAVLTGGQYIFLTDDSGIGNTHAKPKFPCYHVEKLKDVMVRVVSDKLTGQRSLPDPQKLIRTVGHSENGVCVAEIPL